MTEKSGPPPELAPSIAIPMLTEPFIEGEPTHLPEDPQVAWEVLRQAVRVGTIVLGGATSVPTMEYTSHLSSVPDLPTLVPPDLYVESVRRVSLVLGRARSLRGVRGLRQEPLSGVEKEQAELLFETFAQDVVTLAGQRFAQSPKLVVWHNPSFYEAVQGFYATSHDITPGRVRELCRLYPQDPIAKIEQWIARTQQNTSVQPGQVRLRSSPQLPERVTAQDLASVPGGNRSGMEKVRSLVLKNNKKTPIQEYEQVCRAVTALAGDVNEISAENVGLYAHLAYYHPADPVMALTTYHEVVADLQAQYGKDKDLTEGRIRTFARLYLADAMQELVAYKQRVSDGRHLASELGLEVGDVLLCNLAMRSRKPITAERIAIETAGLTRKKRSKRRSYEHLDPWMTDYAERLVPADKLPKALEGIQTFIVRSLITARYAAERSGLGAADEKGRFLSVNTAELALHIQDVEALLKYHGLQKVVMPAGLDMPRLPQGTWSKDILPNVDAKAEGWGSDARKVLAYVRGRFREGAPKHDPQKAGEVYRAAIEGLQGRGDIPRGLSPDGSLVAPYVQTLFERYIAIAPSRVANYGWGAEVVMRYLTDVDEMRAYLDVEAALKTALLIGAVDMRLFRRAAQKMGVSDAQLRTLGPQHEPITKIGLLLGAK